MVILCRVEQPQYKPIFIYPAGYFIVGHLSRHDMSAWASQNRLVLGQRKVDELLNQEKTSKVGIHNRLLQAGWDNDYLLKIFAR